MKILTAVPWFVWLLFGYVILRGVKGLQSQVMSIKKIVIVPVIFLAHFWHTLAQKLAVSDGAQQQIKNF